MGKKYIEIRWHGRGGMGAKTGALLLGEAMMQQGKYIQAFPEYGPERRGAPVTAYNRIADEPIRIHYGIKSPDVIIILDPTLLNSENIWTGIREDTIFIINSGLEPSQLKEKFHIKNTVFVVNATSISENIIGRNLPNTPLLGAFVKATGTIPFDEFLKSVYERLKIKYKEDIVQKNLEAIKKAYEEVRKA